MKTVTEWRCRRDINNHYVISASFCIGTRRAVFSHCASREFFNGRARLSNGVECIIYLLQSQIDQYILEHGEL